jgi:hypothetical protein
MPTFIKKYENIQTKMINHNINIIPFFLVIYTIRFKNNLWKLKILNSHFNLIGKKFLYEFYEIDEQM